MLKKILGLNPILAAFLAQPLLFVCLSVLFCNKIFKQTKKAIPDASYMRLRNVRQVSTAERGGGDKFDR